MKPHIGSQVIFVGSIFPMKEIDGRIISFLFVIRKKTQYHHFPVITVVS